MQRTGGAGKALPFLGLRVSGIVQAGDLKTDCRNRRQAFDGGPSYMPVSQATSARISGGIIAKIHNPSWSAFVPGIFFPVGMFGT